MITKNPIIKIAKTIDSLLNTFYSTQSDYCLSDYIYSDPDLECPIAQTIVDQTSPNNIFLGIVFSNSFIESHREENCPSESLCHDNLSLFSVIAEEVSHFRCIYRTSDAEKQISRFDLELQSEFDKLIAAMMLTNIQCGTHHALPIARLMLDSTSTYSPDPLYDRAGNIAARWWWSHLNVHRNDLLKSKEVARMLREICSYQGDKKLSYIENSTSKNLKKSA